MKSERSGFQTDLMVIFTTTSMHLLSVSAFVLELYSLAGNAQQEAERENKDTWRERERQRARGGRAEKTTEEVHRKEPLFLLMQIESLIFNGSQKDAEDLSEDQQRKL